MVYFVINQEFNGSFGIWIDSWFWIKATLHKAIWRYFVQCWLKQALIVAAMICGRFFVCIKKILGKNTWLYCWFGIKYNGSVFF
jgi:hypothetical protein